MGLRQRRRRLVFRLEPFLEVRIGLAARLRPATRPRSCGIFVGRRRDVERLLRFLDDPECAAQQRLDPPRLGEQALSLGPAPSA